jgi:hypothetical protein
MPVTVYLASTLLMGVVLVGVAVAVGRLAPGRAVPTPRREPGEGRVAAVGEAAEGVAGSPAAWVVLFLGLVVAFGAGTVLALQGAAAGVGRLLLGGFTLVLAVYGLSGVYGSLRGLGRPRSEAVAVTAFTVGLLGVLAVTARLLV